MGTLKHKTFMKRTLEDVDTSGGAVGGEPIGKKPRRGCCCGDAACIAATIETSEKKKPDVRFLSDAPEIIVIDGRDSENLRRYRDDIWYTVSEIFCSGQ